MSRISRREFAKRLSAAMGSAAALLSAELPAWARGREAAFPGSPMQKNAGKRPIMISSANGYHFGGMSVGYEKLAAGADTLDAAIACVNMNETNPDDMSVGYGGLPNENGVVQLDSCVMHGPTMQCGAVGAIENVKTPSLVAKSIMDNTDEIFLVGRGATEFAKSMGFEMVDLLTDRARRAWVLWRETRSLYDSWGAGLDSPDYEKMQEMKKRGPDFAYFVQKKAAELGIPEDEHEVAVNAVLHPPHGTINCQALNAKGEISGVTTTSGLAWKIPSRVGDSPIIGAGNYVDGEVGAGGSTGRGEENIRVAGGHTLVELMRQGKTPMEACLETLRRVQHFFKAYPERLKKVEIQFYALRVDGAYGAATLWGPRPGQKPAQFAVNDGTNRLEDMAYLLKWEG
jgi:N4-(beta-N-acetylglucosaminyl)-L-asparaginase